jgi:hypothetical protein
MIEYLPKVNDYASRELLPKCDRVAEKPLIERVSSEEVSDN